MKIFSFLIFAFGCFSVSYAQTIRRVNNNPGVTGLNVYTTAQAAHDAANSNDILIVEPSVTSYGILVVTKPLKIYGNGYYLNTNTELKADQRNSILDLVIFTTGSDGSLISGFYITSSVNNFNDFRGLSIYGVSNITVQRCNINFMLSISNRNWDNNINTNVSNITISENHLSNSNILEATTWIVPTYTISNVIVSNNILSGGISASTTPQIQNWAIRNNTFTAGTISLANSIFENNILSSGGTPAFNNVTYSYNVSTTNSFSGGVGNQNSVVVSTQFIGTGAGISDDERYQIKSGSPLKTAGAGGIEVGAYGGSTPYVVSGIPAIPSIVNMTNTATGTSSTPLSVTISVKSNN